jgi:hypothetical protein
MEAPFNYITESLNITKKVALECSRSGDNEYSVNYYMNQSKYKKQLDKLNPIQVRQELNDLGAWDDDELSNHADNLQRLFWVSCGNIVDML